MTLGPHHHMASARALMLCPGHGPTTDEQVAAHAIDPPMRLSRTGAMGRISLPHATFTPMDCLHRGALPSSVVAVGFVWFGHSPPASARVCGLKRRPVEPSTKHLSGVRTQAVANHWLAQTGGWRRRTGQAEQTSREAARGSGGRLLRAGAALPVSGPHMRLENRKPACQPVWQGPQTTVNGLGRLTASVTATTAVGMGVGC
jgi:hypothetical protein